MKPRICVAIPARKVSDLAKMIERAEDLGADLIEVRLDYMNTDDAAVTNKFENIVRQASVPLIATNRQHGQGGRRPQNEEKRVQTLARAAETGFQYVDIELTTSELNAIVRRLKDHGAKPIVSFHDLKGTPAEADMEKVLRSQIKAGAEICKLVTTANDVTDNIQCLVLTKRMSEVTKIVCFAMGRKGLLSRVFSPVFGAYFTLASLESGLETASGQMSIAELKELYIRMGVAE